MPNAFFLNIIPSFLYPVRMAFPKPIKLNVLMASYLNYEFKKNSILNEEKTALRVKNYLYTNNF